MKPCNIIGALSSLASLVLFADAFGAAASSEAAALGLTSTHEKGTVSLMTDPMLSDRRLIFRVAAQNRTAQPARFGIDDIKVSTAAGKPVAVLPVSELVAEVRAANRKERRPSAHQPSTYSRPGTTTGSRGQVDVSGGLTGGGDIANRTMTDSSRGAVPDDPATQQQIAALEAAILQSITIAPGQATGGQIVTERLKFARKEERAVRVTVSFNGEQHEFLFEPPAEK